MWATVLGVFSILNPIAFVKKICQYFKRPRLEVYYDSAETYHKARDVDFGGILGNFSHVMVRNRGKDTAENCVGELRRIEEWKNGKFQPVPTYKNIMRLKWAHEKDWSPKDVEDVPIRLDVAYVHQGYDTLHFFTEKYPSGNQTDFPPGNYKVRIRVKCDNAGGVEKDFLVKYDAGIFDSLEISPFSS
jgi:hypothetical protein